MPHKVEKLLVDLRLACSEIADFIQGKSLDSYLKDRLLQLALEREFEIVGEALNRLERLDPKGLDQHIPEYRKIIGFRNIIAHGYDVIDDATLWDLASNRTPELLSQVETYLVAIGA
ncbi:MAG: DUF86 domain-containing protein [Puniceicoccaceae bacterium]|nr:MAG: DUF86 domain-containing protein [Puniceicoccaceae bacterium]